MKNKILKIIARAPEFKVTTFTGTVYHGSNKGEESTHNIWHYSGEHYSKNDALIAFVLKELKEKVTEVVKCRFSVKNK